MIIETISTAGTLSGTSTGAVVMIFTGGSDTLTARQRLVNISSRARVGTGDAVAIAGFVISGQVSKPVLIRAVGPTLGARRSTFGGVLAAPRLELFRGSTSLAVNTGIAANRAAIDAPLSRRRRSPWAPRAPMRRSSRRWLPVITPRSSVARTNTAGVALIEVYDLSGDDGRPETAQHRHPRVGWHG